MNKPAGRVTGIKRTSSGIGVATAERSVAEGADVYDPGRRQKELGVAVSQIGRNAIGERGDAARLRDLDRLHAQIAKGKGHLDILFANVGIANQRAPRGALARTLAAMWLASDSLPTGARATKPPRKP
jgi:NAD(P)-dependent dehydrogenase (short-subunit alcohol dehydrogenase family)